MGAFCSNQSSVYGQKRGKRHKTEPKLNRMKTVSFLEQLLHASMARASCAPFEMPPPAPDPSGRNGWDGGG